MKNRILPLLILLLFSNYCVNAQSDQALTGIPQEIATDKGNIKGTLLIPASVKPIPVVLLISGSGPTDRDGNNPYMKNNSLKMVAEALYAQGVASLRYDKRGLAESVGANIPEQDLRFDHYIKDATAWLLKLKADKRFSNVIVMGHSEGSLIGMIAAHNAKADAVISLAGIGQSANKLIREQLQAQPKMVTDAALPILDQLELGKTVTEVNPMLFALFRPSIQPYLLSWFKYDPQVEIKKLTVPVLLVQGNQDLQVTDQEARLLHAAYPKSKLVLVDGMNHVLKETTPDKAENIATYSNATLPLAANLMPEVISFIKTLK